MSRYIDACKFAEKAFDIAYPIVYDSNSHERGLSLMGIAQLLDEQPEVDLVEVVRCKDCVHAVKPDKHAELTSTVLHCMAYRGEEVLHVWHKYKKYYKNYSLVFDDEYCCFGVRKDG